MSIRVAVRCRPFNQRERDLNSECVITMRGANTELRQPNEPSGTLLACGPTRPTRPCRIEFSTLGYQTHSPLCCYCTGKRGHSREFTYDYSFWSHNPADPHFVKQDDVYQLIGTEMLKNAFDGYNTCLFAYGQVKYVCMFEVSFLEAYDVALVY